MIRPDLYPGPNEYYHEWSERKYPAETKPERDALEDLADKIIDRVREFDA